MPECRLLRKIDISLSRVNVANVNAPSILTFVDAYTGIP